MKIHSIISLGSILTLIKLGAVEGWENSEFEMFDLVEEVGQNFYDVLSLPQDASSKDIKQAYRRLSVKLHPDKNPDPNAETQFRQLVGIYEVLKDKELREAYDRVLVEGLPNWRQPIYYMRRYRKLVLWEVTVLVLAIFSIGQYFVGWAVYWEKRLTVSEKVEAEIRKTQRTRKAQKEGPKQEEVMASYEHLLEKPSFWNLAPFQILRFTKYLVVQMPFDIVSLFQEYKKIKREKEEERLKQEAEAEEERLIEEEPKKPRKRKIFVAPEKGDEESSEVPIWTQTQEKTTDKTPKLQPIVSGGLWTDEDINELVKLCSKYPGGTPGRWELIAEFLRRPVPEVTFMAKKVMERLASRKNDEPLVPLESKIKIKTKGGGKSLEFSSASSWSLEEQKALENALQLYPKGASERWDKIASAVPGRSKEECMDRFKYLAEMVMKKKKEEEVVDEKIEKESEEVERIEEEESSIIQEAQLEIELPKKQGKLSKKEKRKLKKMEISSDEEDDDDWCVLEESS